MKLALITGGCRRLGAAIAERLAEEDYALALHASQYPSPDDALMAVLDEHATRWKGFAADLSVESEIMQLLPTIKDHFGAAPDVLVNNAALFGADRPESADFDGLMDHYAVNTVAPALLSQAFAAHGHGGVIINILDQRIANPHGDQLSYSLSKIALAGLTDILARDLAPDIRVNAVAPGLTIPTEEYDPAQMDAVTQVMPLEQLPSPSQIAETVAWLARAEAVTGQTIYVDGGAHMKAFDRDFLHLI